MLKPTMLGSPARRICRTASRRVAATSLTAICAVTLAACGASGGTATGGNAGGGDIVVGVNAALSGPYGFLGKFDSDGAQAYAQWINAQGGVLGHKYRLVVENNQSQPSVAVAAMRKLIGEDHAQFVMGPESTSTAEAATPIALSSKMVQFLWSANWPLKGLTAGQSTSYAFPGIPEVDAVGAQTLQNNLIAPMKVKKLGLILSATSFGQDLLPPLRRDAAKLGYEIVGTQTVQPGATDVTPQVLGVLGTHPDMVALWTEPGPGTITALKALRAQSPTIPVYITGGMDTPAFVQAVGGPATLNNVYLEGNAVKYVDTLPADSPLRPDIENYLQAVKAAGHGAPDELYNLYQGWETMAELTAAIKSANSIDPEKVKTAMTHQKLTTVGVQWSRTPENYMSYTYDTFAVTLNNGTFAPLKTP